LCGTSDENAGFFRLIAFFPKGVKARASTIAGSKETHKIKDPMFQVFSFHFPIGD